MELILALNMYLLMIAGVLFLIDMFIPLGRFFLWFGMASSGLWNLMSFLALLNDHESSVAPLWDKDKVESPKNPEVTLLSWGLSVASMSAFGYLIFG